MAAAIVQIIALAQVRAEGMQSLASCRSSYFMPESDNNVPNTMRNAMNSAAAAAAEYAPPMPSSSGVTSAVVPLIRVKVAFNTRGEKWSEIYDSDSHKVRPDVDPIDCVIIYVSGRSLPFLALTLASCPMYRH